MSCQHQDVVISLLQAYNFQSLDKRLRLSMWVELNGVEVCTAKNREPQTCDTKGFLQDCIVDKPSICKETRRLKVYIERFFKLFQR